MKEEATISTSNSSNIQQTTNVINIQFFMCSYKYVFFNDRLMQQPNRTLIHLQLLSMIHSSYVMFYEICLVLMLIVKLYGQLLSKYNNNNPKKIQTIILTMTNRMQQKRKKMKNRERNKINIIE